MARSATLEGAQTATTRLLPPGGADDSAVKLARHAGMSLFPWQEEILTESARLNAEGRWSAFEVCAIVPRQNGKSYLILARVLAGALVYGERLILYSAHEYRTAQEVWRTLLELVRSDPLSKYVAKLHTASGREEVEFTNGARFRLMARTRVSGRGLFPDCILLDEAFILSEEVLASLIPSMAARPNPQIYYLSSAGTWEALVLLGLRERGHKGTATDFAYWEWHADAADDHRDPKVWAGSNPSLGRLITQTTVRRELESMSRKAFMRERLGVWSESLAETVFSEERITPLIVPVPAPPSPDTLVGWGLDVAHDRTGASIAAAYYGPDDVPVVVLVDSRAGAGWVPRRLAELRDTRYLSAIAYDGYGGLGDIAEWVERDYQIIPEPLRHADYPVACAALAQRVTDGTIRFAAAPGLISDLTGAVARVTRTGWMWERKTTTPPTNLIAATCALHALEHGAAGVGIY